MQTTQKILLTCLIGFRVFKNVFTHAGLVYVIQGSASNHIKDYGPVTASSSLSCRHPLDAAGYITAHNLEC